MLSDPFFYYYAECRYAECRRAYVSVCVCVRVCVRACVCVYDNDLTTVTHF
jgi:hypothetical protein